MKTKLFTGFVAVSVVLFAFQALPRCSSVDPDTGKTGDVVSTKGENLDKKSLAEIYFTDGTKDTKLVVAEQSDTEIKFKVPKIPAGRYHLLTLTANKSQMIEQPVVFTVEE